jgi:hypothetical protein
MNETIPLDGSCVPVMTFNYTTHTWHPRVIGNTSVYQKWFGDCKEGHAFYMQYFVGAGCKEGTFGVGSPGRIFALTGTALTDIIDGTCKNIERPEDDSQSQRLMCTKAPTKANSPTKAPTKAPTVAPQPVVPSSDARAAATTKVTTSITFTGMTEGQFTAHKARVKLALASTFQVHESLIEVFIDSTRRLLGVPARSLSAEDVQLAVKLFVPPAEAGAMQATVTQIQSDPSTLIAAVQAETSIAVVPSLTAPAIVPDQTPPGSGAPTGVPTAAPTDDAAPQPTLPAAQPASSSLDAGAWVGIGFACAAGSTIAIVLAVRQERKKKLERELAENSPYYKIGDDAL